MSLFYPALLEGEEGRVSLVHCTLLVQNKYLKTRDSVLVGRTLSAHGVSCSY